MKKFLLSTVYLIGLTSIALAQGQIPAGTILGNPTGSRALPRAATPSAYGISTPSWPVSLAQFGAVCNGAATTGMLTAITNAIAAGHKVLGLPKNCWYFPGDGLSTPDNIEIVGESWETSVIASTDQSNAAKDWKVGAHTILRNVATRAEFCYRQPPPLNTVKTCPLGFYVNLKNTAQSIANYGFNFLTLIVPASITLPNGVVQTDNQGLLVQTEGSGDGLFMATPTGATGVNIRISTQGTSDSGILIQNGEANPTLPHFGLHVVETSSGASGGASISLDRKGNAINLDIVDFASATSPYTNPMLRLISSQQVFGPIARIFQTNINSSTTLLSLEAGNGGGVYTGDFLATLKNGVVMHELSSNGNITAAGALGIGTTTIETAADIRAPGSNSGTVQIRGSNASYGNNAFGGTVFGKLQFNWDPATGATAYSYMPNIRAIWDAASSFERIAGLEFHVANVGDVLAMKIFGSGGVNIGAPTGGDKGLGTINAAGDIYKNNSAYTNPDFVFEHFYRGKIEQFARNDRAKDYDGLMPLPALRDFTSANLRLPRIDNGPIGAFARGDIALEKIEEAHLYILELHERIIALETQRHTKGWVHADHQADDRYGASRRASHRRIDASAKPKPVKIHSVHSR